jgi:hypothetical protein
MFVNFEWPKVIKKVLVVIEVIKALQIARGCNVDRVV